MKHILLLGLALISPLLAVSAHAEPTVPYHTKKVLAASAYAEPTVTYHTQKIGDLEIFYREAGSKNAQSILLLHGFPTSSHMFRDLIPLLADKYHVIAPDYPGFGYSSTPSVKAFNYSFDNLAQVMEQFTRAIALKSYVLYAQDYGGPIGFRLATANPQKVKGLIIQNANAYDAGVTPLFRDVVLKLGMERNSANEAAVRTLFELDVTKKQYLEGAEHPARINPDAWQHAQWGMDRPGNKDIQLALQADYINNIALYDGWHAYFRKHQPPTLVVWGKGDFIFAEPGANAYKADLKDIEVHILNAGHFALEEKADVISAHIKRFFGKRRI
jgi:pimeloyl-ACP methyl ester carboxylesterase